MKMSRNMSKVDRNRTLLFFLFFFFQLILITCLKKNTSTPDEVKALNSTYFCLVNKTKGKPKIRTRFSLLSWY